MNEITINPTERLTFSLMDETDAELMWQLDQDEEVMRFITGGKKTTKQEIQDIMLPRLASYRDPEKGWGLWKVLRSEDMTYLGWILVRPMHFFTEQRDDSDIELGWRFHRSAWGYGYATEAAKAVMEAVAEHTDVTQFSAIADMENVASINIMKKLGMSFLKRDFYKDPLINTEIDYYTVRL